MSGTALTTFSPSSSRSTRSTPWVEGCCGPMLRTIVLVAPTAVSTVVMESQSAERNLTFALRREITPERRTFKALGQEDAAQVRVASELDAKEVENLSLEPIGPGPDGLQRIHHGMLGADASAQANTFAARNRNQLIVQLEARFDGVAVQASGIAEQVEKQGGILLALLRRGAKQFLGDDDGGVPAVFDHLGDRLGVPGTKVLDYKLSACVGELRHLNKVLKGLCWRYFRDLCQSSAPFFQR